MVHVGETSSITIVIIALRIEFAGKLAPIPSVCSRVAHVVECAGCTFPITALPAKFIQVELSGAHVGQWI